MINSITLKNVATYDNIGVQISDLKKINFIYGANGSGKTTISNLIEAPHNESFSQCSIDWKDDLPIKTIVFNKHFRENNFGKGNMPGVFTLGQATKEEIEAIGKMQDELSKIKESGIQKKATIKTQEEEKKSEEDGFKEKVWSIIYKKYESDFKDAFVGSISSKEKFKDKLLHEYSENSSSLRKIEELKQKAQTILGKVPERMELITIHDFTKLLEIENDKIWQKKIIGKADVEIAKLIQKLNLNDWVNEGIKHIQGDSDICPFCQQPTINADFRKQLEDYFDDSFIADTQSIKDNEEEYNIIAQNLINTLQGIETKEKANKETKLNCESFSADIKTLSSLFISNKELLNNKIKEPSRSIDLISIKEQSEKIQSLLKEANTAIEKHNKIVDNYKTEKIQLISEIWKYIVEDNKTLISDFIKKTTGLQKGIDALNKQRDELLEQYKNLDIKIKDANKNVTSVQPSVDEINKTLKYYGFLNFEIVPSKTEVNQYKIQRENGDIAETTLSEGEVTFITVLYFLQLAKGGISQEVVNDDRILVIDDPISSLDSTVLFVVSSLLKEIIKSIKNNEGHIKQLILLTHNVYFHKEVSFIDGRTKENNDTFYWILRKKENISNIDPFERKNPIQNSYELLWQELRNKERNSAITIQNIMRRIIESYFKILGKYTDDKLINNFGNKQEQEICRSLLCWINDGSHCIPDDIFIENQENTIEKYYTVFREIFEKTKHIEHYNMMMQKSIDEKENAE
jgi:wobble nucleotide-excising tRNase